MRRLVIMVALAVAPGCRQILGLADPVLATADAASEVPGDTARDVSSAIDATSLPVSCKAMLAAVPGTASGIYMIDPDGSGPEPPLHVYCDMTTAPLLDAKGGWTLVFVPATLDYDSATIGYTTASTTLMHDATEALIAYRDTDQTVVDNFASFALPDAWRTASPLQAPGTDLSLTVTITDLDGSGTLGTSTLRFGYGNWTSNCDGVWENGASYGRLCVAGTAAPLFTAFASAEGDFCVQGTQPYSTTACAPTRMFTIAVR